MDVTVTGRGRTRRPGVRVHRVRDLDPAARVTRDGIPVTTVARTLLDLAETVRPSAVERAFEEADRLRLLDLAEIDRLLRRSRGRHGLGRLTTLVAAHAGPAPDTKSELERRFLELCERANLPLPQTNVLVEGFLVDAYWPKRRLVIELDSWAFHRARASFERDRRKDARLLAAGYQVLRVTARRLECERPAIEQEVRALLN